MGSLVDAFKHHLYRFAGFLDVEETGSFFIKMSLIRCLMSPIVLFLWSLPMLLSVAEFKVNGHGAAEWRDK